MGCAISIVKYITFLFNFLFVLAGIALLTVGILLKLKIGEVEEVLDGKIGIPAILLIVIGSIVFIVSFYGCCGAIRESHCMVTTYAVFLLTILVLQIAIAVLAFVYSDDTDSILKTTISDLVGKYYEDEASKKVMDVVQDRLQCCGANGPNDYVKSIGNILNPLPPSCCMQGDVCHYNFGIRANYFTTGCTVALEEFLNYAGTVIGAVASGIAAVEIVGIVFALCLANSIKNESRRRDI